MTCGVHGIIYIHAHAHRPIYILYRKRVCRLKGDVSVFQKIGLKSYIDMVEEQDKLLPIANVGKIMKQILPPRAKISKEAKQTMQECASEFISFVTGEASDKCHKENRKTVNGDDICWALSTLGFDNYTEAIVRYLHKYREAERERAKNQSKVTATSSNEEKAKESSSHKTSKQTTSVQQIDETSSAPSELRALKKGKSSLTNPP